MHVQAIDAVIADVNAMMQGVAGVQFNMFDRSMALEWHTVVHTFHDQNNEAKKATRNLINTSFRRLRSAEGAFELLQNFKKIKSKGAIKEQMGSKLQDILEQFSREIDAVTSIFIAERCVTHRGMDLAPRCLNVHLAHMTKPACPLSQACRQIVTFGCEPF
jgi:Dynein heavy chain, N-terminal region 1